MNFGRTGLLQVGDRVQLTAPNNAAGLANRELGTVERIDPSGDMKLRMDSGRTATIAADKPAHLDHGYAVTSHSAQGATADRVIVHAEGGQSAAVVNERFAYVAGSRMRDGLDVYTDNSQQLTSSLARQFDKAKVVARFPTEGDNDASYLDLSTPYEQAIKEAERRCAQKQK